MIISEDSWRSLKSSEDVRSPSLSLRTRACSQCFSLQKSEIARKDCHLFILHMVSFLTWIWIDIFVSRKMATTHIFQSGIRNWPASVSTHRCEIHAQGVRVGRYTILTWWLEVLIIFFTYTKKCLFLTLLKCILTRSNFISEYKLHPVGNQVMYIRKMQLKNGMAFKVTLWLTRLLLLNLGQKKGALEIP